MLSTATRCIISAIICLFSCLSYAESTSGPLHPNEPSVFLKSLNDTSAKQPAIEAKTSLPAEPGKQPSVNSVSAAATAENLTPAAPATQLQQLQTVQSQLQSTLASLQQQSSQLQSSLSLLAQQLAQPATKQLATSSAANQSLQQLRHEHQQIQSSLDALRQAEGQLQARILAVNQQLTTLQQQPVSTEKPNSSAIAAVAPTAASIKKEVENKAHEVAPTINAVTMTQPATTSLPTISAAAATVNVNATPSLAAPTPTITSPPNVSKQADNSPASGQAAPVTTAVPAISSLQSAAMQPLPALPANAVATASVNKPNSLTPTNASMATVKPQATAFAAPQPPVAVSNQFLAWLQDPATMLRIGAAFIALALLALIILFWPKSKQKKINQPAAPVSTARQETLSSNELLDDEQADLAPEYDFMSSQDAIPTRLDLTRGYIEMGKFAEAKEAIQPVFEKGTLEQQNEAEELLEKIRHAERHADAGA